MKKIALIGFGLLAFLLCLIVAIPFFVDVDKFRPQIVQVANDNINGRLELGKLKLSLWGKIKIEVAGLKLNSNKNEELLVVDDAYFHLPLMSLISGSPEINLRMEKPRVFALKDKAGKINWLTLVKKGAPGDARSEPEPSPQTPPSAPAAPTAPKGVKGKKGAQAPRLDTLTVGQAATTQAPPTENARTPSGTTAELPTIATKARLGFEMHNATIVYKDASTQLESKIENFNFLMRNLSLSKEMTLEAWADLSTKMGKDLELKGPMKITGKALPTLVGSKLDFIKAELHANFDGVDITQGVMFHKKAGMDFNADLAAKVSEKELVLESFVFKFFNAEVKAKGTVTNLNAGAASADGTPNPAPNGTGPVVNMTVSSNEISLSSWEQVIPMLKEYSLEGQMKLDAQANGPSTKLNYKADFNATVKAKSPLLKAEPKVELQVQVLTDQIEKLLLTMKAPGNDFKAQGKMVSFTRPNLNIAFTSSGMDLDQLIDFAKMDAAKKPTASFRLGLTEANAAETAPAKADLDASLNSMRINPMMVGMVANSTVDMKFVKAKGIRLDDVKGKAGMQNLVAAVDGFGWKMFGGTVQMSGSSNLMPAMPTYQFKAAVQNFDLKQAVESNVAMFKNTVIGTAAFSMTGSGASFNTEPMLKNLKATGNLKVTGAKFASIDIGKVVKEGINGALGKVGDKIPGMKGKQINGLPNGESKYESISSDFTILGGRFSAPNFFAKAEPNKGVDIKGATEVGMLDQSLKTTWYVIDTYNMTKARDITIEQQGVRVEHILAEGNDPVKFPVNAGCKIAEPCYSYTEVPEYFAKVALNNVSKAATGRVKTEAKKKVEQLIEDKAPPALKDKLKKLGGGLFGN